MERQKEQLNGDVATLEKNNKELDAEEEDIKAAIAAAAEAEKKKKAAEAAAAEEAKKKLEEQKKLEQQNSNKNNSSSSNSSNNSNSSSNNSSSDSNNDDNGGGNTTPSGSGGFTWPCPGYYTISSTFGNRWGTTHGAIDIAGGNAGAAIVAAKGGTVVRVVTGCSHNYPKSGSCGCGGGYGNYVIIQHDGTYSTLYGHMASVSVSVGQTVSAGQTIGYVGSTGFSTGFHLHFEVRVNGTKVDPMQYL